MRVKISELVRATEGSLLCGDPDLSVDSYVIDTRRVKPRGVFFALKGTRTDGHKFLREAAASGAAVAVIQQPPEPDVPAPPALIQVDDSARALGRCGSWVRRRRPPRKWIAVTGSNGKTTTKELIAEGLSARRRVHRTPGNLNNHLGVPLTLLACPDDTEICVLELAMSAPGEIAMLTEMTDPDVGVVTNVRGTHLEFFASLDDIAAAKGELFAMMRDDATAVVNLDDPNVRVQSLRHVGPRVTYGQQGRADLRVERILNRFVPGAALTLRHGDQLHTVQLRIGGAHAALDALAALAVVLAAGEEIGPAIEKLEQFEALPGRGTVHRLEQGIVLVDESYNSSPAALSSVLETVRSSEPEGRKVLVMGDMLELGRLAPALHREAGKRAAAAGVQLLMAVGKLSRSAAETAHRSGVSEVHHHPDSTAAAESVAEFLRIGDLVVVKGSRGMRMERVVRAITAHWGEMT